MATQTTYDSKTGQTIIRNVPDVQAQAPLAPITTVPAGNQPSLSSSVTPNDIQNGASKTYTVKSGDTLSKIASQYGVPISSITGYKSGDINKIGVGEVLTIGGKGTSAIDPKAIPTNTIVPTTPIGVTTPTTTTPSTAGAYGDTVTKTLDEYINEAKPSTKSAAEVQQDALTARISELLGQTSGQAQALSNAEAEQGVPDLTKQLQDINNQIKTTRAEQNALNVDVQGKPITMNSIIGEQAQINAVMDAKIYTLSAQAQALQGNITLAKENAQKAVDLKYAPILEELKIKKAQLELIQPTLTKEEKIRAEALAQKNKDEANALAEKIANEKQKSTALISWQGAYPDAGITLSDTLEQAQLKIQKSNTFKTEVASKGADIAYKNMQTAKLGNEIAPAVKNQETFEMYNLAQQILNSGNIKNITGFQSLAAITPGSPTQYTKNQYEQLKAFLSLENRQKLKGSGAISDYESRVLASAATALGRNLSEADFTKELKKISGVLASASGIEVLVKVVNPSDGKSKVGSLSRDGINEAISQGYVIEYQ